MSVKEYNSDNQGLPDEAFVHPPPKSLECPICRNTLNNPRQCPSAHAFCLNCITTALQFNPTCPYCSAPLAVAQLTLSGKREIVEELQVYCCTKGISKFVKKKLMKVYLGQSKDTCFVSNTNDAS